MFCALLLQLLLLLLSVGAEVVLRLRAEVPVPVVAHPGEDVEALVDRGIHGRGDDLHVGVDVGHRVRPELGGDDGDQQDVVLGNIVVLQYRLWGGRRFKVIPRAQATAQKTH